MESKELNEILNKTRKTPNISLTTKQVEEIIKDLEVLEELKRSHIEYIEEEDRCYFVLKNTKRKEKSFTSKTFSSFWKGVFGNDK